MSNSSKTVLVTGGSKGIGLAIVKRFVKADMQVITCARDKDYWEDIVKNDSTLKKVGFQQVDLSSQQEIKQLFDYIKDSYRKLDIAINNAAMPILAAGKFRTLNLEDIRQNIENDLLMPIECMHKELELMSAGANIVNITSISGFVATTQASIYTAAKHGVEGLSKTLALELSSQKIRVNCVAPGLTMTPRWNKRFATKDSSADLAKIEQQLPAGRFAKPEEIAAAAFWLASDEASYINGHTLVVDGGFSIADSRTCQYE
ncbi:MAG: SDR family oxidoreductase [Lentisphaerae bacterium]|nr:SDR family oxidoreductase [Lentisphaerota bacterium]MCP4103125.1 SDR family oxidoreductase [Lentisphaerota bacterium]